MPYNTYNPLHKNLTPIFHKDFNILQMVAYQNSENNNSSNLKSCNCNAKTYFNSFHLLFVEKSV